MKKTLTVLLTLIFLLSLGILPAQAQAQGRPTSFAYIPLVSPQGETALPVEFRARQAFEAMAPQLMEAQAKGQIVRFEPEFDFGLLKVEYQAGFDLAATMTVEPGASPLVFDNAQSVLKYTQVSQSLRSSSVHPSDTNPSIEIGLYYSCFYAYDMGANNYYHVYLTDTTGRLAGSSIGYADGAGEIYGCFSGNWTTMVPGYGFLFNLYNNAGTTLLNTFSTTIARLGISSISAASRTVVGTAPANSQPYFYLGHPGLDASDNWTDTYIDMTASSKGAWSVKLDSSVAMRGGDEIGIGLINPGTPFTFYRWFWAPYIYCRLGGNYCGLYGIPGKPAKLSIVHAKKTYQYSGRFSSSGYFSANLVDGNTDPIYMVAGDKASGSGVKIWALPFLTAVPNITNDTVEGFAPANDYFQVELDIYNNSLHNWDWASRWVGATAGLYSADFSGDFDIKTTDRLFAYLYFQDPVTGNETYYDNYVDP